MCLAAVVTEEHARAAMQLGNDDALGTVDDERTVVRHQRQLAEVNLLLAHVLHGLLGARGFLIQNDEAHLDALRGSVGQTAQLTLFHIKYRLSESVADVFERSITGVAGDRKHALEGSEQPDLVATYLGLVGLQERAIGVELDGEQVRHLENARLFAEILADTLLLGEGICHRVTSKRK